MIKRILACFFAVLFVSGALLSLGACMPALPEGEVHIVTTNFACYDFASEIVGRKNTRVSVEFLSAGDAHSFNPTYGDIAKIQNADLFLYVGGESDSALDTILQNAKGVKVFKLIDTVPLLHEMEDGHTEDDGHEHTYDEHVWTSPYNAALIVDKLAKVMMEIDPDEAATYQANAKAYSEELMALDQEFTSLFASVDKPTLVFGDRFPFLYFAERYGVRHFAAFPGCSSASEPSPHTVMKLVETIKREKISTVFYIESGTHSVADRIAAESGAVTALMHSCHKVTPAEIQDGTTYLSLMRDNYRAIEKALGKS